MRIGKHAHGTGRPIARILADASARQVNGMPVDRSPPGRGDAMTHSRRHQEEIPCPRPIPPLPR